MPTPDQGPVPKRLDTTVEDIDKLCRYHGIPFPRHMKSSETIVTWVDARDYFLLLKRLQTAMGMR